MRGMKRKISLEIIVWENEYWVVYDFQKVKARRVITFPKTYSGRLDLLAFIMGYLGLDLKIGRRFRELFKGERDEN